MEQSQPIELSSVIESVTVFTDRALVTRMATASLKSGEHRLVFAGLPESMEESSVQVSGTGGGEIKDIRVKQVFYSRMPETEKRRLQMEKLALEDDLKNIEDAINRAAQEKQFLEKIAGRVTGITEQSSPGELDPEKWIGMFAFYEGRMKSLDSQLRAEEKKKRETLEALQAAAARLKAAGASKEWIKRQAEILLAVPKEGEISLALSYIVYGPSWNPVYNLRVKGDDELVTVEYNALVRQNTSEDWKGVDLMLSTANPQISGTMPELSPWFVNIIKPLPPPAPRMVTASAGPGFGMKKMAAKMKDVYDSGAEMEDDRDEIVAEPAPQLEVQAAEVTAGAASVVFAIPGKTDVASGGGDTQVSVMRKDFKAEFTYESVPKFTPYAFLTAKAENVSEYPLLPGKSYIYLDGCFVANSRLDFIAPGEEFQTSLGVDESMKVEYKLLKRFIKKEGITGKRESLMYDYAIKITNNKSKEQKITVKDQIPVSGSQDITVKLLKPEYKQDTDTLAKNDENILTWTLTVKPKETLTLPFSFCVEYPIGARVGGI